MVAGGGSRVERRDPRRPHAETIRHDLYWLRTRVSHRLRLFTNHLVSTIRKNRASLLGYS